MKINVDLMGIKSNMATGSSRLLKPKIKSPKLNPNSQIERQIESHNFPKLVRLSPRSQYIFLIIKKFIQVNSSFS